MRNFLTPYLSANPSEFWTRWHISLSTWLRDYLYIPLGGNRHGSVMTIRNLMITMFLGGLWHGAGVLLIAWGVYHGLLLVLYRFVPIDQWLINRFGWLGKLVSIVVFFHLVCVGWIFFRATPQELLPIWHSILQTPTIVTQFFGAIKPAIGPLLSGQANPVSVVRGAIEATLGTNWIFGVLSWGLVLFATPMVIADLLAYRRGVEFPDLFARMPMLVRSVAIVTVFYGIVFFARRQANEFIYFAF